MNRLAKGLAILFLPLIYLLCALSLVVLVIWTHFTQRDKPP